MEPLHDSLNEQENKTHNEGISWILLEIVLIVSILFIARTVHLLHNVRKIRLMKDPRTISPLTNLLSKEKTTSKRPLKTLVVLGSGGHTTEMLHLIKNLNPDHYYPVVLIVATTDTTSLRRVQAYPHSLPVQNKDNLIEEEKNNNGGRIYRIPRSREVGQSYWSSILTTMYSFFFAFWLVGFKVQPDLILVNGPGTCLPIAVSAFLFRIVGWMDETKIIFVESFCRVTSLSLTGKLLYPIADLFVVCWEQLHEVYPLTYLVTSFIPKTIDRQKR
ncbi:UDP-N-acetylglucosamine transferase subunit ALG14 [Fragilariopsis cylindrus CCMP1102]|uniref:UDP-N-acetylglucosamine transferase subunit ALG14 n=1 Tax=Fragilariopsis cylindrus CCMP1102 TaxID=635003 RepID=A0A1E7F7P1_9STRA|nr:UDP-N-acetylglucosamine transferase subunit ALG14 [Fragilariopsis cylindrus CCMP1102]|eukprot:OEU14167.1 UDP-N-acetylglucosamine transferase subunit ALG14 [Fragilariopsis cylindrus CCMP1102]